MQTPQNNLSIDSVVNDIKIALNSDSEIDKDDNLLIKDENDSIILDLNEYGEEVYKI